MNHLKKPTNGHSKHEKAPFGDKKIEFPVQYDMKIVVAFEKTIEQIKFAIIEICDRMKVSHTFKSEKVSSKQNYISITLAIILDDQEHMNNFYEELRKLPGLKMAI